MPPTCPLSRCSGASFCFITRTSDYPRSPWPSACSFKKYRCASSDKLSPQSRAARPDGGKSRRIHMTHSTDGLPVEFMYWEECPSHERALQLLEEVLDAEGVPAQIRK